MVRAALAVVLCCAAIAPVRADDGFLTRLAGAVRARLDAAAASHVVKLVPPVPIARSWSEQKLGSIDLGAPLAAVAAADLDGDGKAELYLVTAREVIAVGLAGKAVRELGRVAFTGDPAVPASRDVVGTAVVDGRALIAAVSGWAGELRVEWRGKALTATPGAAGFRVCGARMHLVAGRNHFRDRGAGLFDARCRELRDPAGYPLRVRGELSTTGALDIAVERCAANGTSCQPAGSYRYRDVGVAFDLADLDRNGTPELVASQAGAPGDPDAVRVIALGAPANKTMFRRPFQGGVAGLAVADGDGDGVAEILAVVRLAGATRVDIWRIE